jgi:hypothetical protein
MMGTWERAHALNVTVPIKVSETDVFPLVPKKPRYLFRSLDGNSGSYARSSQSYRGNLPADLQGAFERTNNTEARQLVYKRLASGAGFLRDLAYTAWIESGKPFAGLQDDDTMSDPKNPKYNPATGSAPAP